MIEFKPLGPEHAGKLVYLCADEFVYNTTLNIPKNYTAEDAIKFINLPQTEHSRHFGVFKVNTNDLIGVFNFSINKDNKAIIGGFIGKEYSGMGFGTLALKNIISVIFETTNVNCVSATCFRDNLASSRMQEKAGMVFEGILRSHRFKDGRYIDAKSFSLLREEWIK